MQSTLDIMRPYVLATCSNCEGLFVCSVKEVHVVIDLVGDSQTLEVDCHDCTEHFDPRDLWIDANGEVIFNKIFHEDIEGR